VEDSAQLRRGLRAVPGSGVLLRAALLLSLLLSTGAKAEPWLEVGDRTMRSDFEILVAAGVLDGPVTTWPIPAGELSHLSEPARLDGQPQYVQFAAHRILNRLIGEGQPQGLVPEAWLRATNEPDVVRDFGTLARDKVGGEVGVVLDTNKFSGALRVSSQPQLDDQNSQLALDGSYLSFLLWNWQLYGGFVDQWFGPGWTSSLILSNNARPMPKIGIMRNDPHAFETPWLSWLGPWQFSSFIGVLNGPRIDGDTIYGAVRFTFEPLHGLEIGLTRTSELCGKNHHCNPLDEFHFTNTASSPSPVNDEAAVDLKYTRSFGSLSVSPYVQLMNEDTGPFVHANTSYLIGASLAGPFGQDGAHWRVTAEYTDTIATLNWFGFGKLDYGAAYNDGKYVDGMRYRGRTLGFSLDSDSRLFSLAGALTDPDGWTYRLVYYRANINSDQLAGLVPVVYPDQLYPDPNESNVVSAQPVQIDQVEAGLSIPLRPLTFDFSVRDQDNRPYPSGGGKLSGEIGISYRF
jgi:hypothetical protein